MRVTFVESPSFSHVRDAYFDDDASFAAFQAGLTREPCAGEVIPGTGGARKVRWLSRRKGKRGGLRVVYGYWKRYAHILLLVVYEKSSKEDLTQAEAARVAALMRAYEAHLKEVASGAK